MKRSDILFLASVDRERCVAALFRCLKVSHYSQGHIREVLKSLESSCRSHFYVGGCEWKQDQTWLYARKVKKS